MKRIKTKKNKVLKIILISIIVFTLLFLCISTYFLHLILDSKQIYETEAVTQQHVFHQYSVLTRLKDLLYESKPGEVGILTISQVEVNAIIATIANSDSLWDFLFSFRRVGKDPKKRPYKIVFKENRFDIKYSFPINYNTPFGKHINLAVSGTPEFNPKGISLGLKSVSVGDLPLSPYQVEKILHSLLKDDKSDEIFKRIHEVVVKAYITPKKNLVIYFYPYRIKTVFTEWF
jgi:hypothetical protein